MHGRTAGLAILLGADLAVPYVFAPYYLAYRHTRDTLSTLGTDISPVQPWVQGWLIAFGVALIAVAWPLRKTALGLGLIAFAVGAGILAGLFPADPAGAVETLSGKVHGLGAGIGSLALLAGCVLGARAANYTVALILAILASAAFTVFVFSQPLELAGLFQRLYLTTAYLAAILIAARLPRAPHPG